MEKGTISVQRQTRPVHVPTWWQEFQKLTLCRTHHDNLLHNTLHHPPTSSIILSTEIHHLGDTMTDTVQHPKILQTQVPLFRGNREKYNEFEHLLLNHLRPHQQKLSEEQKLTYFQSLLRDDAIELWQSLKMTNQTTLAQVLRYFKKEYAKEDLKEVAKYKFDQMRYDPST